MLIAIGLWGSVFVFPWFAQTPVLASADEPAIPLSQPEEADRLSGEGQFAAAVTSGGAASEEPAIESEVEDSEVSISDPLGPWNRAMFHFNDKFYFWLLKPVSQGYGAVFPEELRVCFRNLFSTLVTPVRFVNCALQGKFKSAGNEAVRFGVNTTLGFFGCVDQAKDKFAIDKQEEDFGQTLGTWGAGPAFYIEWPILGPSSLRDSIGFVGDFFLDPRTYIFSDPIFYIVRPVEIVNETSLRIGEYENLKEAAMDPYVAKRDIYYQYRESKIKR